MATSIGIAAAKKHVSTYFIKCNDLLQQLKRAQLENRLDARLKHFSKYRLLIIDEITKAVMICDGKSLELNSLVVMKKKAA